ncbi:ATP-binding protein [Streptomyces sp. NPDC049040]|uniref:ATP-binding protein n=1 Tax=Streptomyces sp. NPDC049040 TaxID=3365593 RepID=UPI00371F77CD
MVREESPPGIAGFATLRVWLLPAVVTAAVAVLVVFLVPSSARVPVALLGAVAVAAVIAGCIAVRRGRQIEELGAVVEAHRALLAQQEAATVRLAGVVLPEAMERLRKGEYHEEVFASLSAGNVHEAELTAEFQAAHRAVLRSVLDAVVAEEDLRESAQRAFVNVARRIQAFVHQQAQELREMEDRHGNAPDVFGDLLRLDHGNSLIGRLAATIAVLGGARPGHQWRKPVPLYSVLRGAMGQIIPYQRVDLHSVSEVAVVGPAVGPLIHALAELLDNATSYSPPHTRVHLTTVEVQSGIAIEIEDGGVSMSEEARKRAERMLHNAQQGIDMADLGETPRLGLAAVGKLAQANDFTVSLRESAYGGVRAVLVVPQKLITTTTTVSGLALAHGIGTFSGPREVPAPTHQTRQTTGPVSTDGAGEAPAGTPRQDTGLPQRRRRAQTAPRQAPAQAAPETASAPQPGEWLAAFTSGASGDTAPHDTSTGSTGKGEQQ